MIDSKVDSIVVGTSPISILVAIRQANSGKNILIIEKNQHFGGAWKNFEINDGIVSEASCHLIEHYRNVYRIIEDISGIKFIYCSPQPLKIFNNGKRELYSNPSQFFIEASIQFITLLKIPASLVIQSINRLLTKKYKINIGSRVSKFDRIHIWDSFLFFMSHRIPAFATFRGIMEPSCGYAYFAEHLIVQAKKAGVNILHDEVCAVSLRKDSSIVNLKSGVKVECELLYIPESLSLAKIDGLLEVFGSLSEIKLTSYWHILIRLYNSSESDTYPSYIHLPDNTLFHRITLDKTNVNEEGQQFLIQARFDPKLRRDLNELISNLLLHTSICSSAPNFTVLHIFCEEFIASKRDCMFANGIRRYDNIEVLKTIGDMARNIAINPFFKK